MKSVEVHLTAEVAVSAFAVSSIQSCGPMLGVLISTDIDANNSANNGVYVCVDGITQEIIPVRCVLAEDRVFVWRKSVYLKEILNKWPMKSQTLGRKTKRCFVLRDNVLTYYKVDPDILEVDAMAAAGSRSIQQGSKSPQKRKDPHRVVLCADTEIKESTHFKYRCITLHTPTDVLWFTADQPHAESIWIQEMSLVIEQLRKKDALRRCLQCDITHLQTLAVTLQGGYTTRASLVPSLHIPQINEITWTQDPPSHALVCVDAVGGDSTLFASSAVDDCIRTVAIFGRPGEYFAEITLFNEDKTTVQITDIPVEVLICAVKIFKHLLLVSGNFGWFGIFDPRILVLITPTLEPPAQVAHCEESRILSMSFYHLVGKQMKESLLVATGDRLGGLGIWLVDLESYSFVLKNFSSVEQPVICTRFVPPSPQHHGDKRRHDVSLPMLIIGTESKCCIYDLAIENSENPEPDVGNIVRPSDSWCTRCRQMIDSCNSFIGETAFYSIRHTHWRVDVTPTPANTPTQSEMSLQSPVFDCSNCISSSEPHNCCESDIALEVWVDKITTNAEKNWLQCLKVLKMDLANTQRLIAFFSAGSSIAVTISCVAFPTMRQSFFTRIILMIAASDVVVSAVGALGFPENGSVACTVQAALETFFLRANWLWTTMLVHQMHNFVMNSRMNINEMRIHSLIWSLSLLCTLLPLIDGNFGRIGDYSSSEMCFYQSANNSWIMAWVLIDWIGLVFACIIYMTYLITRVYLKYRVMNDISAATGVLSLVRSLYVYPLVMLCTWGMNCLTNLVVTMVSNNNPSTQQRFAISVSAVAAMSNGLLLGVVFFSKSNEARFQWRRLFRKLCSCEEAGSSLRTHNYNMDFDESVNKQSENNTLEEIFITDVSGLGVRSQYSSSVVILKDEDFGLNRLSSV